MRTFVITGYGSMPLKIRIRTHNFNGKDLDLLSQARAKSILYEEKTEKRGAAKKSQSPK